MLTTSVLQPLIDWVNTPQSDAELVNRIDVKLVRTPGGGPPTENFEELFTGLVGYDRAVGRWSGTLRGTLLSGTNGAGKGDFDDRDNQVRFFVNGAATSNHPINMAVDHTDGYPHNNVWQVNLGEEPDRAGEWIFRLAQSLPTPR
jgi:hypothetical protein